MRALTITFLVLILILGFGLRVYKLGFQSLWLDEAVSVLVSDLNVPSLIRGIAGESNPPLYFIVLHSWMRIFGNSELSSRFLSLIFGVLLVVIVFKLGNLLFDSEVGLGSALLVALSPWLVRYSQYVRTYSLATLLVALSVLFYLKALKFNKISTWWGYVLTSSLAIYTLYSAFFILLFELTFFLAMWPKYKGLAKRFLFSRVAMALAFLPWLPTFIVQVQRGQDWKAPLVSLLDIPRLFYVFSLGWTLKPERYNLWVILPALLIFLLLFFRGIFWSRRGRASLLPNEEAVFLGMYLFVPFFSYLLFSQLMKVNFVTRYLIVVVPAYYLICAKGLASFRRWSLKIGILLPLIIAWGISLGNWYFDPKYSIEPWRDVARYVESNLGSNDVVALNASYTIVPFRYYYRGKAQTERVPKEKDGFLVTRENLSMLKEVISRHDRVWLILSHDWHTDPQGLAKEWLERNCERIENKTFTGIQLLLYKVK